MSQFGSRVGSVCRRVGLAAILMCGILWAWNQWGLCGLFAPVRVVSGSMGDVLPGPHWKIDCQACRIQFLCGTDHPPDDRALCPNCGCELNPVNKASPQPGQRVLIDQLSTSVRAPRRWEVVVDRPHTDTNHLRVKRIVGLPGEHVSIHRGDVYVDGAIVRKDLNQLRKMCVLVHDDRFRPSIPGENRQRWLPTSTTTRWRQERNGFSFSPSEARDDDAVTSSTGKEPCTDDSIDWLVYHHRSSLPMAPKRGNESPVTDNYAYNQGLSRDLSVVTDLLLTCRVKLSGAGVLAVLAHDGHQPIEMRWDVGRSHVGLLYQGATVAEATKPAAPPDREVLLEAMVCDRQVQLALDGHTYLAYTYAAANLPLRPSAQPLAIGAADLAVEVTDLCIWRDVYYTHPQGVAVEWSMGGTLAEGEYFLLGDNSPISVDSRHEIADARVARRDIMGRVFPQPEVSYIKVRR